MQHIIFIHSHYYLNVCLVIDIIIRSWDLNCFKGPCMFVDIMGNNN